MDPKFDVWVRTRSGIEFMLVISLLVIASLWSLQARLIAILIVRTCLYKSMKQITDLDISNKFVLPKITVYAFLDITEKCIFRADSSRPWKKSQRETWKPLGKQHIRCAATPGLQAPSSPDRSDFRLVREWLKQLGNIMFCVPCPVFEIVNQCGSIANSSGSTHASKGEHELFHHH